MASAKSRGSNNDPDSETTQVLRLLPQDVLIDRLLPLAPSTPDGDTFVMKVSRSMRGDEMIVHIDTHYAFKRRVQAPSPAAAED